MLQKKFTPKRTICKVTFSIPGEWADKEVAVAGDFNEWDTRSNKLEKSGNNWETLLRVKPNQKYRFKYFIDGEYWENDDSADAYVANEFGTEDSLLEVGN